MFQKLFDRKGATERSSKTDPQISYEKARELASSGDEEARRNLARRADTRPEILYFLAEDQSPDVRREIAGNAATPAQANLLLADDDHEEVRMDLARKISRLLPELDVTEQSRLRDLTFTLIERLASDQLPRVRAMLSEELRHSEIAPPDVVKQLARDVEAIVAAPILEYSPLLSDVDLMEIIERGVAEGALPAIARRQNVSENVSGAIAESLDVPAVAALLGNETAQIREDTLDYIIDNAVDVDAWHEPLVGRQELSVRAVRRIATFVGRSLVEILVDTHDLDPDTEKELKVVLETRIKEGTGGADAEIAAPSIDALIADGALDDEAVVAAIARADRGFVRAALVHLSGFSESKVDKILTSQSAKAVTALAWSSDLSMRTAMQLQARIAHVPPGEILNARNGVDYPVTDDVLREMLDLFAD